MHTRRTLWAAIALAALVACQTGAGPPQVLSFTADPVAITAGSSSTLRWLVTGATTITVAPGVGDVSGTNATVVTPATTTTYTLTASSAGGSATADVTVTVDTSVDVAGHVLGLDGRPAPGGGRARPAARSALGAPPHATGDGGALGDAGAAERLAELLEEAHKLPEKRAKTRLNRVGKTQRLKGKKLRGQVKAGRGKVRLD